MRERGAPEPVAVPAHVDERGAACAHHASATAEALLQLALVGTRAPGFHHDCASKLQGLLMALDEISELTADGSDDLRSAVEAATEASRELNALLSTNRALTKPPARAPIALGELVSRAAARVAVSVAAIWAVCPGSSVMSESKGTKPRCSTWSRCFPASDTRSSGVLPSTRSSMRTIDSLGVDSMCSMPRGRPSAV